MARTPSNMLPLNTKAPFFNLFDTISKQDKNLDELKGLYATVIMFICNHCPFVIHVNPTLVSLAEEYQKKGVSFIAISSNDINKYPQDRPELMTIHAKENNYSFPYLFDESQEVAKAYDAACTPDFYIFDNHLNLKYRGQLDDSRPDNGIKPTGVDLKKALDAMLSKKEISPLQKPSIGCNIKWK